MNRRDVLGALGLGALSPALSACGKVFRIPLADMTRVGGEVDQGAENVWREAAAYARWCPSPHNVQPWLLRVVSSTEAELYYDPRRLLPKTDPTSCFVVAGLAMFVEYLSVAMRPSGYAIEATYVLQPLDPSATGPVLFAHLRRKPATETEDFDRRLILLRKTSRLPYDGRPVDDQDFQRLIPFARELGNDVQWSSQRSFVDWTLDLNRRTLFSDLDDPVTRGELRRWIRCTKDEAAAAKDGLWSHCMRFPGWLFRSFFDQHEKYVSGVRRGLSERLLMRGLAGTRSVVWWSGPFDGLEDWIRAGTVLARTWLELTRQGLSFHPFGSIITNPGAYALLKERLGLQGSTDRVWLIARVGRSDVPPRSYRLETPDIFIREREAV